MQQTPIVLYLISDLMFGPRVSSILRGTGFTPLAYKASDAVETQTGLDQGGGGAPVVGLIDMGERGTDPIKAITAMRSAGVTTIAFCGHTDTDTQAAATAAGANFVVARSEVNTNLPNLILKAAAYQPDPDCDFC